MNLIECGHISVLLFDTFCLKRTIMGPEAVIFVCSSSLDRHGLPRHDPTAGAKPQNPSFRICGVDRGCSGLINSFVVKSVYIRTIFSQYAVIIWVAQWCTSWNGQPWPCVRAPGTKPRGIMCLLVGVMAKVQVQAPRWVAFLFLALLFVVVARLI